MFVNSNQAYPTPAGDNFNLPALNFTQFVSPYFGLTIGKYATLTSNSGDMNEFAHGTSVPVPWDCCPESTRKASARRRSSG